MKISHFEITAKPFSFPKHDIIDAQAENNLKIVDKLWKLSMDFFAS